MGEGSNERGKRGRSGDIPWHVEISSDYSVQSSFNTVRLRAGGKEGGREDNWPAYSQK